MASPTREAVDGALAGVVDPTFDKPMVDIGTLADVRLDGSTVQVSAKLSSPAPAVREAVKSAVEGALREVGVESVEIDFDVQVPAREVLGDDPVPGVKNVILVMSGKGGVGKSTVATNLALALHGMGTRVGLLDADMYGPSIPTMMGITGHPRSVDGKRIQPLERFGLKIMSIGFLVENPRDAIVWRGPMLHGALNQFLADVDWGDLDYLVLDLPPGTGDVALTLAQRLKQGTVAVMVTTPQEVALQDVFKGVDMCRKLGIPLAGVVENMSWFIDTAGVKHELFGSGGGQKVADFAKVPLLGQIPIEAAVRERGDEGNPVVRSMPGSEAARAVVSIAERVAERIAIDAFDRAGGDKAPAASGKKRLRILR
jgi:ATP-binding protein involved in chromosome partitioning